MQSGSNSSSSSSSAKAANLNKIVAFLNAVHSPVVQATPDSKVYTCTWKIINNNINNKLVTCVGPSVVYTAHGGLVEKALRTAFSDEAKAAGLASFGQNLVSDDHKSGCYHYINSRAFLSSLEVLANRYLTCKHPGYIEGATAGVLSKIPDDVSMNLVSRFLTAADAASLAKTNRSAAKGAREGKKKDDDQKKLLSSSSNSSHSASSAAGAGAGAGGAAAAAAAAAPAGSTSSTRFFAASSSSSSSQSLSLEDLLNKGTPETYEERPGKQYLVFQNDADFQTALRALENDSGFRDSYRVAGQTQTIEIKNLIVRDATTGKIKINNQRPQKPR